MRTLIVSNLISLDGYAAGPGGDVMALPFDTTFSDYNLALMQAADTLVSGATTYRGFVGYWPPIADDPAQPEVERAISRRHRELDHLVVSDTLTEAETGPWRENTRIVKRAEARDAIAALKQREGGPLVAFGSMTTWNDLLAAGLVDELFLTLSSKLAGGAAALTIVAGRELVEPADLELVWVLEGGGNLFTRWRVPH